MIKRVIKKNVHFQSIQFGFGLKQTTKQTIKLKSNNNNDNEQVHLYTCEQVQK